MAKRATRICPVCGAPLIVDDFCTSCGAYLNKRILKLWNEQRGNSKPGNTARKPKGRRGKR